MKKAPSRKRARPTGRDMRPEYRLDYGRARPNRFAARMKGTVVAVVLDPDVAAIFRTSESVNVVLRSVISALPERVREAVAHYGMQPTAKRGGRCLTVSRRWPSRS